LLWSVLALGSVAGTAYAGWRASPMADPAFDPLASAGVWLTERAGAEHEEATPLEERAPAAPITARITAPEDRAIAEAPATTVITPDAIPSAAIPSEEIAPAALPPEIVEGAELGTPEQPTEAAPVAPLEPEPAPLAAPTIEEEPGSAPAEAPPEITEVAPPAPPSAPPDPWAREVPPGLLELRALVEGGSSAPRPALLRRIGTYARHHPDDARALALLAHGYVRARWMSEALERYAEAHTVDADVRGDPRMQENLVALSSSEVVGARASALVIAIYGAEALMAIDAALANGGLDGAARTRLRALRDALDAHP
nr:hypothetical protein [Myxococcota bacterium]